MILWLYKYKIYIILTTSIKNYHQSLSRLIIAVDAEYRKELKYSHLDATHCFIPIAVETLGAFGTHARTFFREVARRVRLVTDDPLAHQFLAQRISVAVQRGNAAAVLGCIGGANSS